MDSELLVSLTWLVGSFIVVLLLAVAVLRFTSQPGLRLWAVAGIVLLWYPAAIAYGLVYRTLALPRGAAHGSGFEHAYFVGGLLLLPMAAAWSLLRCGLAIWRAPRRAQWYIGSAAVVAYGALWALTYYVGGPEARKMTLTRAGVSASWVEVPRDPRFIDPPYIQGSMTYYCEVVCYVPLVLTVRHGYSLGGDDAGNGYTALHLWIGVLSEPFLL